MVRRGPIRTDKDYLIAAEEPLSLSSFSRRSKSGNRFLSGLHCRDEFEAALVQEEKDRIKYHDDALNPIRAQVKGITDGLVKEKKTRIANERQIVADIDRECQQMHTDI